jgi:uncharacterized protein (TIGR02099 family)
MVKRTFNWLVVFIIAFCVIVASLVMTLRFALPKINQYPSEISAYLSQQLGARVNIESIEALWVQSKPQFKINNIYIVDPKHDARAVAIKTVVAEFDVIQSIRSFSPVFKHLAVDGFSLQAEQKYSRWLTVFSPPVDAANKALNTPKVKVKQGVDQLLKVLLRQSQIVFKNASLILNPERLPRRVVGPLQFVIDNTADMHQLSGSAELKHYGEQSLVEFALEAEQIAPEITDTALKVYAKFSNISEQLLALNLWDVGVGVRQMSLDSKVWATLKNGLVYDVVGDATINSLHFDDTKYPSLVDSHMSFALSTQGDEQVIGLSNILISDGKSALKIPALNSVLSTTVPRKIKQIAVSEIDLNALSNEILKQEFVSDKLKKVLTTLAAKGQVSNLVVNLSKKTLRDFRLTADLQNVSVNHYTGAPALSGVTGLLDMGAFDGRINLDAQDFSLFFPRLFAKKWDYQSANGVVSWKINHSEKGLESVWVGSQLLSVARNDMQARGRFSVMLPLDLTEQAELVLMLSMQNNPLSDVLNYIPPKLVGEGLDQWLKKAALAGQLQESGFVLRTGIRKDIAEPINASVQMYYKLKDAKVNFDQNWPNLTADDVLVTFWDGDLSVSSTKAQIAANSVTELWVKKRPSINALTVAASLSGDLGKLYSKIQTKPAKKLLPQAIRHWKLTGEHQSALALTIPLIAKDKEQSEGASTANREFHINLATAFNNVSLLDDKLQLKAKKSRGKIVFDSLTGLSSNDISLSAFGFPATLAIASKKDKKAVKTTVMLKGKAAIKDVKPWLNSEHLDKLKGSTAFAAKLDYCTNSNCNQLLINTDLAGVAIDLPAPWGKDAKSKRKLQILKPTQENEAVIWRYNYADIVRGVTRMASVTAKGVVVDDGATSIALGGARPKLPAGTGVHVIGVLRDVDIDALIPYFSQGPNGAKTPVKGANAQSSEFKSLDMSVANVTVLGQKLKRGQLNLMTQQGLLRGRFDTALASGSVLIPKNKKKTIELVLKTLNFEKSKKGSIKSKAQNKWLVSQSLQPANWPKVSVLVERLNYNKQNIGRWSARLSPTKKGYKARDIKGELAGTKISGELAFTEDAKAVRTFMDLKAKGGNFGDLLTQLGFSKVLESRSGDIQASLSWKGYPWGISQGNLNGRLNFSMENGRIVEAGTSANFLRIFGILNLNTVIKRLKLDFSDLLESGIAFDKVAASYFLQDGIATSQKPLKLEGSSTSVEMSGTINLANESLEQKMFVSIPLTSNAPLAALLLATPQVAGIAFVVDKLLGKRLAKLTALRYNISGPWINPKVSPVVAGIKKK